MRTRLSPDDIKKCEDFGRMVAAGYAAGEKDASKILAVPGRPPIHDDWEAQALGRMGELAFARLTKLPDEILNWSARCDGSYDIKLHDLTIDVKSSGHPRASRLIWPVSKNHFIDKAADILVFARVKTENGEAEVEMAGWTGRHTFIEKHEISNDGDVLTPGTKYMRKKNLNNMRDLFHITTIAAVAGK